MTEQTEVTAPAVDPQLVGIGGWLVLPAIGLVLGPIGGVRCVSLMSIVTPHR